jgi:hypothetical protein
MAPEGDNGTSAALDSIASDLEALKADIANLTEKVRVMIAQRVAERPVAILLLAFGIGLLGGRMSRH